MTMNTSSFNTIVAEAMDEIKGAWEEIERKEYLTRLTYEDVADMTREERDALEKAIDIERRFYLMEDWDVYYDAYCLIREVENDEYREENEDKVRAFFEEYFEGKTWAEIRNNPELYDAWGFYSDWHKDCFGYRPHDIVCGVYVSPW